MLEVVQEANEHMQVDGGAALLFYNFDFWETQLVPLRIVTAAFEG